MFIKVTIVGVGYVGFSNEMLLTQHNEMAALDIDEHKIALLNDKKSPIVDIQISDFLARDNFMTTIDKAMAYKSAGFVTFAKPTDYYI